jgi:Xaa-Pro aminopeptidase
VKPDYTARQARARSLAEDEGLAGIYVTAGPNFRWLAGETAHPGGWPIWLSAIVLPVAGEPAMVISEMHARIFDLDACPIEHVFTYVDGEDPKPALRAAVGRAGVRDEVLGVDSALWIGDAELVAATVSARLREASHVFGRLRAVKDAYEIEQLRIAARAHDEGYRRAVEVIRPGVTVAEAGSAIVQAMVEAGSEELSIAGTFGELSDRRFGTKEIVDVDLFPGSHGGYSADTARNVFIGEPTGEERRLYEATAAAYDASFAAVRPGIPLETIHATCAAVMRDAGYEQVWKVGHGVGLADSHEPPLLQRGNDDPVEVGMVFTIDPGAFIAKNTPIHIEDTVLVTEAGATALNSYPREMAVV